MVNRITSIIASTIVGKMIASKTIEIEEKELYEYALVCMILKYIPIVLILCIGLVIGNLFSVATILAVFFWLRKYSGGYHASTSEKCFVLSIVLIETVSLFFSKMINFTCCLLLMLASITVLVILAPVDSNTRRFSIRENVVFKKKLLIRMTEISVMCVLLVCFKNYKIARCIVAGFFMTSFTVIIGFFKNKIYHNEISSISFK